MLNKRDLGAGYLGGTGIGLLTGLAVYFVVTTQSFVITSLGTAGAILLTGSLLISAWWFRKSDLPHRSIWVIAQWSAIGLGAATSFAILLIFVRLAIPGIDFFPSLIATTIAAGGVLGLFFGASRDLHVKYAELEQRNAQYSVLNRILRHDIRNDMSVVIGHAEVLLDLEDPEIHRSAQAIRRKGQDVVTLANDIRAINSLVEGGSEESVELNDLLAGVEAEIDQGYPNVDLAVEYPSGEQVHVPVLTRSLVDNLVENAIHHNDRPPEIRLVASVDEADGTLEIVVEDNGPGIPEEEVAVLSNGRESAFEHSDGLGLWLIKWIVDHYGGELDIGSAEPRGSVVRVVLPLSAEEVQPAS